MQSYPLLKITTIVAPAHAIDVVYILRFIQVTKPIISYRIIRFQVEQSNKIVALTVFMFILTISVEQAKFRYNGGSISNRNLTITLSIGIYDSGHCKVIHPSSDIHELRSIYVHWFTSLRRYIWLFLSKIEHWNVVSERILTFLPLFTILTLSNNDAIHGNLSTSNVTNSQASC